MKITKTTVLTLVALGGVGAAIYFFNKSKKTSKPVADKAARGDQESMLDESIFPLEEGSEGEEVKLLQQYLNRSSSCAAKKPTPHPNARMRTFLPLEEDGIFGDHTAWVLNTCYKTPSVSVETFKRMRAGLEKMTAK